MAEVEHGTPSDPLLPGLAEALDEVAMAAQFRRVGIDTDRLSAEVVRHKPAQRCTIRYQLLTAGRRRKLYGKVFAEGAPRIARSASALAAASDHDDRLPLMMPVVAIVDRLSLVVFEGCPNAVQFHLTAVDDRVDRMVRRDQWTALGRALAALHGSDVAGLVRHDPATDLTELGDLSAVVGVYDAPLAQGFHAMLDQMAPSLATGAELAPSHGALRTDQVLISDNRIALVDLDSACLAEPERDLANLIAYLDWRVVRGASTLATVAAALDELLLGYADAGGQVDDRRLDLWRAASMLKIVGRRFSGQQTDEWPLTHQLLSDAERLVASR